MSWTDFLTTFSPVPLLDHPGPYTPLDLSTGAPVWAGNRDFEDLDRFTARISGLLAEAGAAVGYGGYAEVRPVYTTPLFAEPGPDGTPRYRDTHLGLDLWTDAGTPVLALLDATVHSFSYDPARGGYGSTLLLEHHPTPDLTFWTLYGHLDLASIGDITEGMPFRAGEVVARIGPPAENGHWPPHLHFQVILDLQDYRGDYPGVAYPERAAYWLRRCPDPRGLVKIL